MIPCLPLTKNKCICMSICLSAELIAPSLWVYIKIFFSWIQGVLITRFVNPVQEVITMIQGKGWKCRKKKFAVKGANRMFFDFLSSGFFF